MRDSKFRLAVIGIFLLGVLVGALGLHLLAPQHPGSPPPPPERMAEDIVRRLNRELDLTPEQSIAIEKTVRATAARLFDLKRECFPAEDNAIMEGIAAVRAELDDERQKKLDKLIEPILEHRLRILDEMRPAQSPAP